MRSDTQSRRSSQPLAFTDELPDEILEGLTEGEHGYKYRVIEGMVVPPYVTPARYELSRTLKTRPDDICCTGYPKSGTNWLANLVVHIVNDGEVPPDTKLRERVQWVESAIHYVRSRDELDAMASPRLFSSHMPFHMAVGGDPLNNQCRYVCIARNPKDVAVSYYHFEAGQSWSGHYDGQWQHWLRMFVEGKLQRGHWSENVLSWWRHRDADNVHFLKYEDLSKGFGSTLRSLGRFLGSELSDELVAKIEKSTAFENMRKDSFSDLRDVTDMSHLYWKGVVGSWKDQFTVRESEWFDAAYREWLRGTGLEFEFE